MGVIALIIGGAVIGWIIAVAGRRDGRTGEAIMTGIVGSIVGAVLTAVINGTLGSVASITRSQLIWGYVVAAVMTIIYLTAGRRWTD